MCAFAGASFARSAAPPISRTGSAADGGLDCTACHRGDAANADQRGRIAIEAASYTPGVRQTIRVTVEHPDAMRWGFQLIARWAGNEQRQAGSFAVAERVRVLCAPNGTDAPCNGEREFASHNAASTRLGSNGRMTWEVEWTPPATDVGDIVFYAAGNAANDGATNAGDLIYTTSTVIRNGAGCAIGGPPTITSVSNAASGAAEMSMNGLVSVYGTNFGVAGRAREVTQAEVRTRTFPRRLDCATVLVNGVPVAITYASATQINFQAPLEALNATTIQVVANAGLSNENRSAARASAIALTQPALFVFSGTSSVAARHADNTTPVAQPGAVPGGRPARAGDTVVLYATGLGLTNPVWASGDIIRSLSPLASPVTILVGGITVPAADIAYQGGAGGAISGLYQINFKIPAGLSPGDQPIVLRQLSLSSQAGTTIPIQ
ncbi:MAG: choice-of-anchor V domain-containing protein [Bryobacteraceae bacterium]|nr:choice-of-anchor V domain-containing protein [Bryobacteraceae bacterium]